ncbi:MAG: GIY-YIG nuclease family protein [Lachnospira sp.]|nr:GIY-YIG nuclease family protein [Lachnospira sp.]
MEDEMYYVYLLRCADGTLYCGSTNNLQRRVKMHNSGRGAKYTKARRPVQLVYWEAAGAKSDALRREAAVKRLTRQRKLELVRAFSEDGGHGESE